MYLAGTDCVNESAPIATKVAELLRNWVQDYRSMLINQLFHLDVRVDRQFQKLRVPQKNNRSKNKGRGVERFGSRGCSELPSLRSSSSELALHLVLVTVSHRSVDLTPNRRQGDNTPKRCHRRDERRIRAVGNHGPRSVRGMTKLAMLRWTKSSPGWRPAMSLAGTRLSEQPTHR